jgi:hypothetical protein
MSQLHIFDDTRAKSNGNGVRPSITCRVIEIDEAELLKVLNIHNAHGAAYSAFRRLYRKHLDLTPRDVARAVREIRLRPSSGSMRSRPTSTNCSPTV